MYKLWLKHSINWFIAKDNQDNDATDTDADRPKTGSYTLVPKADIDFLKKSFKFYDKEKKGFIKDFELQVFYPSIGINLEDHKIEQVLKRLEELNFKKIDENALVQSLHILKEMEMEEPDDSEDEYLDAFVALGGQPNKEGKIEANLLIEIVKDDFELTINMEEYLSSIDSDDNLDFYQFCVLLQQSTGNNPSRFSNLLANRGFSVLQESLFEPEHA